MIPRETKPPRDYEVMDLVLRRGDAVELARLLSVSPQLVRAWCRAPETEEEFTTGKFGPLARLRTVVHLVCEEDGSAERAWPLARYLARLCGGVFVPLRSGSACPDSDVIGRMSAVMRETAEALEAVNESWFGTTPGLVTRGEAARCRREIEEAVAELLALLACIEEER